MSLLKSQHEAFAKFFEMPTREGLRELLRSSIGETDYLDFKESWPEPSKLARHVLALANSGGGALVVGIAQETNGALIAVGLSSIKDAAQLVPQLASIVPKTLEYQVLDFAFAASEYPSLVGKSFQVLLVEDDPKNLPYLALRDAEGVRCNAVYVRSGTSSVEAGQNELQGVINRRIETGHSSQASLDLEKHLSQLRTLDERRDANDCWINEYFKDMQRFDDQESSDFKEFIEAAYVAKKAQIIALLGLTGSWIHHD